MGKVKTNFFFIIITLAVICIVILEEKNHDNYDNEKSVMEAQENLGNNFY